jgi:hypothetical protein
VVDATGYAALKARGLCPHCGCRPAIPEKAICEDCRASSYRNMASARKVRYDARKALGACVRCGIAPAIRNETQCTACKADTQDYVRARRTAPEVQARRRQVNRDWVDRNRERRRQTSRARDQCVRDETLQRYGAVCQCCGETQRQFLTLDHINGGGNTHRRSLFNGKTIGGIAFYRRLRAQGYPDGFQVLCWNCNMARAHYGTCHP